MHNDFKVGDKIVCTCGLWAVPAYGQVYTVVVDKIGIVGTTIGVSHANTFNGLFELVKEDGMSIHGESIICDVKASMTDRELHALSDDALSQMFNYLRQNGVNPRIVEKYLEQKDALRLICEAIAEGYKKEK